MRLRLYLHALRVAQARQLRARFFRPIDRRRFPRPRPPRAFRPLDVGLWRTHAFGHSEEVAGDRSVELLGKVFPYPLADWSLAGEPRLRRFHANYGDEVLGWARRGELDHASEGLAAWIAANPPRPGDPWHPYALSTRVANWIAALSLAPELAGEAVADSLIRQLEYLERNVEEDVLGNHLVRNAKALVLGGLAFGDHRLRARGLEILRREVSEQLLADGGHYERSPVYHLIVLRDLLEVREAAGVDWLTEPIERMRFFAAALTRPDGRPALFNDGALDLAPLLELPEPRIGLTLFPETGYAVLREGGLWLALDCGAPAPPFLPAHAHADALSFQLWVDGQAAVVDPGAYTYEAGADRNWFRSTRAHSTVAAGGRDQFELWGAFRAGPLPQVRLVGSSPLEAEVTYAGVRHRRTITAGPREIVVADDVRGRGSMSSVSSLPLGPGSPVDIEALTASPLARDRGWLAERMLSRTPIEVVRVAAPLPGESGWRLRLPSSA